MGWHRTWLTSHVLAMAPDGHPLNQLPRHSAKPLGPKVSTWLAQESPQTLGFICVSQHYTAIKSYAIFSHLLHSSTSKLAGKQDKASCPLQNSLEQSLWTHPYQPITEKSNSKKDLTLIFLAHLIRKPKSPTFPSFLCFYELKTILRLQAVTNTYNPSTLEAEAGRSQIQSHLAT